MFFALINAFILFPLNARPYEAVIHAGGGGYLNSYELTQEYVYNGYDLIELDFAFTADGELVCAHEFEFGGYSMQDRPTLAQFCNISLPGGVSPMTAKELMSVMNRMGFSVIVDTKEESIFPVLRELRRCAESEGIDFFGRFSVQFYSERDYSVLKAYPFEELWFTNYKANYRYSQILERFGEDGSFTTVVLSKSQWITCPFAWTFAENMKIAVHTVNDKGLAALYGNCGVDYIFSDGNIKNLYF